MKASDAVLFDRWVARRDAEAFGELVARHAAMVYATSKRILGSVADAEDVTQDCFVKLTQAGQEVGMSLGGWLHRVATNGSLDLVRSENRRAAREREYGKAAEASRETEWDDVKGHVDKAIAELPEELRGPIVLHFLEGRTHRVTAKALGLSRSAVTRRVQRGVDEIRQSLRRRGVLVSAAMLGSMLGAEAAETAPAALTATLGKLALAGAGKGGTGATAVTVGGAIAVKKVMVGVVVLLVVAGAVWKLKPEEDPASPANLEPTYIPLESTTVSTSATDLSAVETPEVEASSPEDAALASASAIPVDTGAVAGRVYAAETKKPLSKVNIFISRDSESREQPLHTETNEDGRYRLDGLAPGKYRVIRSRWGLPLLNSGDAPVVTVKAGYLVDGIDFPIVMGLSVSGRVVDEHGNPVANAEVEGREVEGGRVLQSGNALSNDDGEFVMFGLEKTKDFTLSAATLRHAERRRLASDLVGPLTLEKRGLSDIVLTVYPTGSISGKVVDPQGRRMVGVRANLHITDDGYERNARSPVRETELSGPNGAFRIKSIPAHTYQLILLPKDSHTYITAAPPWDAVEVAHGQDITGVVAVLDLKLTITGRVTNENGKPLENVQITCMSGRHARQGITDAQGYYMVHSLVEGQYTARIDQLHGKYVDAREIPGGILEGVLAGSDGIDFVISAGGMAPLSGHVVSAESGEPIPEFKLLVLDGSRYDRPWTGQSFDAHQNKEGAFHVEDVLAGPVTLVACAPGFAETALTLSDVQEGASTSDVVLELRPGLTLSGVVQDGQGNPVADAYIFAGPVPLTEFPEQSAVAQSAEDGTFVATDLSPDVTEVSALSSGFSPASVPVDLTPGGASGVVIVLSRGGTVEGFVYFDNLPMPGQQVLIGAVRSEGHRTTTEENGAFRFEGLQPGNVMLMAQMRPQSGQQSGKSRQIMLPAEVVDGAVTRLDFDFAPLLASVEGVVTYEGEPEPYAQVQVSVATATGTEQFTASADTNGVYTFPNMPAGPAAIQAQSGRSLAKRTVTVQLVDYEALSQDIELGGGATISGGLRGIAQGERGGVFVFHGEVHLPGTTALDLGMAIATHQLELRGQVSLDSDGPFEFTGLDVGRYTVIAVADASRRATSPAEVIQQFATATVDIAAETTYLLDINLR